MTEWISCQYTIYIAAAADRVWQALTDPGQSAAWWAHRNVSDWRPGSRWEHRRLASEAERDALAAGWAAVLSNLKTFLETGRCRPTPRSCARCSWPTRRPGPKAGTT